MNRDEWLHARRRGLGGSDAAGALGVSKWKTELSIYLDKRGEAPEVEQTEPMRWGSLLEEIVRDEYKRRTGQRIYNTPMIFSKRHPWMLANTDARVAKDKRILEIKTSRTADGWGDEGTADVPADYVCQVHHYMVVCEVDVADIAVLIGGADFRIYTIPLDRELADMIIEAERVLWDRIQRGNPPSPRTAADVAVLYRVARSSPVEATDEITYDCKRLLDLRKQISDAQDDADAIALRIKQFIGNGGGDVLVRDGVTLATWKQRAGATRIDTKALKEKEPEVFERFAVTGEPTRTFLLKEVKQ